LLVIFEIILNRKFLNLIHKIYLMIRLLLIVFLIPAFCFAGSILQFPSDLENNREIIKSDSDVEKRFNALQENLILLIKAHKEKEATEEIQNYIRYFPGLENSIEQLMFFLKPENIKKITRLAELDKLNGKKYHPVISPDKKTLYFCLYNESINSRSEDVYKYNEVDVSSGKIEPVIKFNSQFNEAPTYIAPSMDKMLILAQYKNSLGSCDIYEARNSNGDFIITPMPEPINSSFFEADGHYINDSTIMFVSNRPNKDFAVTDKSPGSKYDNWNDTDIYLCERKNNFWTSLINIGPVINTAKSERSPFFVSNSNILLFSSDGHGGFGGIDVFMSVRLSNSSWTLWSEPVNLGSIINTPKDDWGYKLTPDLSCAFYSTTSDIIRVDYDYIDTLKEDLIVEENKLKNSNNILLDSLNKKLTVYFDLNSSRLKSEFTNTLDQVAEILKSVETNNQILSIQVFGHTDSLGSDNYNLRLSKKRAFEVLNYLSEKGFSKDLFLISGLGRSTPIFSNKTREGRAKNRRVEIFFGSN